MSPGAFCQLAMADYERQWTEAAGHQQRHPLRVKIEALRQLRNTANSAEDFGRMLADGCGGDDPIRAMLCAELLPWWERVKT